MIGKVDQRIAIVGTDMAAIQVQQGGLLRRHDIASAHAAEAVRA